MKLIKMLGLALAVALAAMALVGVGSVSATTTQLCKSDPPNTGGSAGLCPGADQLTGVQKIDGLLILGIAILETSLGNFHCQGAHIKAEIESGLNPGSLLGTLNTVTYLECEVLLVGCNNKPATVITTVEPQIICYTPNRA